MLINPRSRTRSLLDVIPVLLLAFLSLAIWLLYGLALPGRLMFDDSYNLKALADVHDWSSAIGFMTSGKVGALGRPLALATFVPQASAWPDNAAAMLRVNFAIHLAAIWASFMLATGLARLRSTTPDHAPLWIGLGVAALWGLSPFLATTHLMIIQRMASLSGLFVLAGLAAFVWAHILTVSRPRLARIVLVTGLGLATALATLSKENGALLPLLALVILWLWIPPERRLSHPVDRALIALLAILPSVLVIGYLAIQLPGILEHGYGPIRYFTPAQRLLSQPTIVLDYLHNLLLPRAIHASPYMDWLPAPKGWLDPPITLIAALVWGGLVTVAIFLRRSAPYVLFGLAFFLVGHLLESGILGLELYFAHRNYVPAFGVYFGLVFGLARVSILYRRLAVAGLATYTLMFGIVLFQVTSAWNQLQFSVEAWMKLNPYSERGAQFLTNYYLLNGDLINTQRVLDDFVKHNPDVPLIQIERTMICLGREEQYPELLRDVLQRLPTAFFEPPATLELIEIAQGNPSLLCPKRDHAAVAAMADALLANPPYANEPITKSNLFLAKAFTSVAMNKPNEAIDLAMQAYRLNSEIDVALFTAAIIVKSGQIEQARHFLEEVRQTAPSDPSKRAAWLKRLNEVKL